MRALAVALFNHIYIWVHDFTTELPDIRRIYGGTSVDATRPELMHYGHVAWGVRHADRNLTTSHDP